jgi:hypothetical protein
MQLSENPTVSEIQTADAFDPEPGISGAL